MGIGRYHSGGEENCVKSAKTKLARFPAQLGAHRYVPPCCMSVSLSIYNRLRVVYGRGGREGVKWGQLGGAKDMGRRFGSQTGPRLGAPAAPNDAQSAYLYLSARWRLLLLT